MRLRDLKVGEDAIIVKILGHGAFRKRLIEMGFVRGKLIKALLSAPMRDPVKYSLMGYEVSLRRSEADLVEVIPVDAADLNNITVHHPPITEDNDGYTAPAAHADFDRERRTINVALIGNPNCGKTSLFNIASGSHEHVGNYSGVTVEAKKGVFNYRGYRFNIVDLPGTYSLSCYSPEELYVRRYLLDETPDVIVNVVVASNLERNLYLTTELIDMDRSMVIALNMYDELEQSGAKLDYDLLGAMIGVPVVPTVSKTGQGVDTLFDTIIKVYDGRHNDVRHVHVNLGDDIETALRGIKDIIKADHSISQQFSPRYLAIKFLEQDSEVESMLKRSAEYDRLCELRTKGRDEVRRLREEDLTSAVAAEKYGYIDGALAETMKGDRTSSSTRSTAIIDAFVTNRLFGIPLFLSVMLMIFWLTFQVGSYPMEWIESAVAALGDIVSGTLPEGPVKDLLVDGIIGGVGSVIVFLPNILILYFCISFMEDSGYMARAAFIMDRAMHKIGLHGKSGDGLRLQRTGHHGHTGNRKPLEPTDHNSDQPVYELLGKTADLRAANRNLFQPVCRICVSRALYGRSIRGRTYSKTAAAIRMEKGRDTFCHGTSAIPCAYTESNSQPHVEQSSTISQQNGRCDSGGMRDSMGAELFPAARERGQDSAKRTDRPVDRLIS